MRRIFIIAIVTSLIALDSHFIGHIAFGSDQSESAALKSAIEAKTKELTQINDKIVETQKNLNTISTQGKTLSKEIQKIDLNINQLSLGIRSSEIRIDRLGLEINDLSASVEDKEASIASKRKAIESFLRQLQASADENELLQFLKSKSLVEGVFDTYSVSKVSEELHTEIGSLEVIKAALAADLSTKAQKKTAVESERTTLKAKLSISEEQKDGKKTLLSSTKNQEKVYQAQLQELEKKQKDIGEAIDAIEAELRAKFDPSLLPVKRPGVIAYPTSDAILTQEYGLTLFAKTAYKSQFHNGLDFGAPLGTPILASRDGKVIAAGNNGKYQYGKYVLLEHDNGLSTLYGHMSKHAVLAGQTVTKGQVIGYVGNTGYSFGNHVHFGLYLSDSVILKNLPSCNCGLVPIGVTINPSDYL